MKSFFYAIGIITILSIQFGRKAYTYTNSNITTGNVIEIKATNDDGLFYAGNDSFPVISFIDNFTEFQFENPYQVRFEKLKQGDVVKIIYEKNNPNSSYIYSFLGFWLPFNEMGIVLLLSLFWLFGVRVYYILTEN